MKYLILSAKLNPQTYGGNEIIILILKKEEEEIDIDFQIYHFYKKQNKTVLSEYSWSYFSLVHILPGGSI